MKIKSLGNFFLFLIIFNKTSYSQQFIRDCASCVEVSKQQIVEMSNTISGFKISKAVLDNGTIFDKKVGDSLIKNNEIFKYKQVFYKDTVANSYYVVYRKLTIAEIHAKENKLKLKKEVDGKIRDSLSGSKLDDLVLKTKDGAVYDLNSLKGKVVVLNFWFTKCKPCVEEIESLHQIMLKFKDLPVIFFAVTWNKKAEVTTFLEKKKFDFIHVTDAMNVIEKFKIPHYPYNIIITPDGRVEYVSDKFSLNTLKKLERRIEKNMERF